MGTSPSTETATALEGWPCQGYTSYPLLKRPRHICANCWRNKSEFQIGLWRHLMFPDCCSESQVSQTALKEKIPIADPLLLGKTMPGKICQREIVMPRIGFKCKRFLAGITTNHWPVTQTPMQLTRDCNASSPLVLSHFRIHQKSQEQVRLLDHIRKPWANKKSKGFFVWSSLLLGALFSWTCDFRERQFLWSTTLRQLNFCKNVLSVLGSIFASIKVSAPLPEAWIWKYENRFVNTVLQNLIVC